jgi:type I restriction enzyme, S subunit
MAVIMDAMTSDLYEHGRADPEYFLPSHTQVESELARVSTVPFGKLGQFSCSAFYPAATHLYTDDGIPFLRCVDIVEFPVISPDQPFARIPIWFADGHSSIRHLKRGDIVISKVGTPCYAALLADEMPDAAMTRTVLGVTNLDHDLVNPYYLIAFLRSRHGFDQLMRERELTIQYQLTLERTRKIRVFLPDRAVQDAIGEIVRQYYRGLRASVEAFAAARELLELRLGLDKLASDKSSVNFNSVDIGDTFVAGRIDAQCFSRQALSYEKWLLSHANCDRLHSLLRDSAKGRLQVEAELGSIDYCSIKHISGREIIDTSKCNAPAGVVLARRGDLLLAITGATIGKIAIVDRYDRLAYSGDMLCLRPARDIDPLYLLTVLDHEIGQVQFVRWITGSTNGHLAPRDIGRVLVPRLGPNDESSIAKLVEASLVRRRQAEDLLEEARGRVSALIEAEVFDEAVGRRCLSECSV